MLLLGVFPRGAEATDPLREPTRQINSIIATLDDGEYVRFMDIGERFLEPDGTLGSLGASCPPCPIPGEFCLNGGRK